MLGFKKNLVDNMDVDKFGLRINYRNSDEFPFYECVAKYGQLTEIKFTTHVVRQHGVESLPFTSPPEIKDYKVFYDSVNDEVPLFFITKKGAYFVRNDLIKDEACH